LPLSSLPSTLIWSHQYFVRCIREVRNCVLPRFYYLRVLKGIRNSAINTELRFMPKNLVQNGMCMRPTVRFIAFFS
jgi:hypothetical protein